MPRRPAAITQADVARAIRAVQAAGLPVHRVVVRADGVAVETVPGPEVDRAGPKLAGERKVVIL
ncbi:hypothetical protein ASF53_05080 [Methylobacterium sp. Leaf123]|uniref:hypothetical protein n=1 Tax=Methylobacterium sp. Leaf123 TaxID=1736264 RepID=UPI0006FCB9B1|nr:hypothetical protein [Methylobacterium sp. Leaf123]KQQ23701.1 hypothetical protein ASF53_05080 [Methylobacterium sp. Leaf123]